MKISNEVSKRTVTFYVHIVVLLHMCRMRSSSRKSSLALLQLTTTHIQDDRKTQIYKQVCMHVCTYLCTDIKGKIP